MMGTNSRPQRGMTPWQQWLQHPERSSMRGAIFKIHFWFGAAIGMYMLLMSISGSIIVYRGELSERFSVEWHVNLHENLLSGSIGRLVNGFGASCLLLLCFTGAIIWWPGIKHWRRSVNVSWRAPFARTMWDLHSALGFWCFAFVLVWGLSGLYFCFPQAFNGLFLIDPSDHFVDRGLFRLSELHFGRFGWFSKILWSILGLALAVLAFTGAVICCRRVIYKKHSNPNREQD